MPTTTSMYSRRQALMMLAALPLAATALPVPPGEVATELPGARLQGQARLRYFGLHVYDIRLWVVDGFRVDAFADMPLALELEYARHLDGTAIAHRSLAEMRRARRISADEEERWGDSMRRLFPNVVKGDRLSGVQRPGEGARFFHNAELRGELRDGEFARAFFGIWLAPTTSEPKMRIALLGPSS